MIPILILAAGASARMRGVDKLMLDVDGQPLLRRQACIALSVSDDVRIALPLPPHPRHDAVADLPVRRIGVADAAEGMSASLRAVFGTLEPEIARAMLLLADLPDITAGDLRQVVTAMQANPDALIWRGATPAGIGGHPIIFDHALFGQFARLTGDSGGQPIISKAGARVHLVPFVDDRARCDLDTPEAWAAWRAARNTPLT